MEASLAFRMGELAYRFEMLLTAKWKVLVTYFLPRSLQSRTRSLEKTKRLAYMSVLLCFFSSLFYRSTTEEWVWARQKASVWNECTLQVPGRYPKGPTKTSQVQGGSCLACSPTATSVKLQTLLLLEWLGSEDDRFSLMCEMDGRSSPTGPSWVWRAGVHQSFTDLLPVCSLTVPTARLKHNAARQGHLEFSEHKALKRRPNTQSDTNTLLF